MASWIAYLALALAIISLITILILAVLFGLAWTNTISVPLFTSLRVQTSSLSPSQTTDVYSIGRYNSYYIPNSLADPPQGGSYKVIITPTETLVQGYIFYISNPSRQSISFEGASGFTVNAANLPATIGTGTATFLVINNRTAQRIS
jgi:hypothetical protein